MFNRSSYRADTRRERGGGNKLPALPFFPSPSDDSPPSLKNVESLERDDELYIFIEARRMEEKLNGLVREIWAVGFGFV